MTAQADNSGTIDHDELVFRLSENDDTVLADVLKHFGGSIRGLLVAKYDDFNEQDAEDAMSIAINKLWENRHQYDESKGALRTYLFKIADNTVKDVFKSGWAKARTTPLDLVDESHFACVEEPVPENEKRRSRKDREKKERQELNDLRSVIDDLPERQRRIVMSDVYAKDRVTDSAWLADELGIAKASVRVYRLRAWKTIRAKMKQQGYDLPPEGEADGK